VNFGRHARHRFNTVRVGTEATGRNANDRLYADTDHKLTDFNTDPLQL